MYDTFVYRNINITDDPINLKEATQYVDTYIYRNYNEYEKKMYAFILNAERVDTKSKQFEDILYDIKRRKVADNLTKILNSDNVVLCISPGNQLPKAFKVFAAKDVKENKNKIKVFIDATDYISFNSSGVYECKKPEWLISHTINAMVSYIYAMVPTKLLGNATILREGSVVWANFFCYLMERLYKINSVPSVKRKVAYLAAIYYQINILNKDFNKNEDSIKANAARVSDIDSREQASVDVFMKAEDFANIDLFLKSLKKYGFKETKTSVFVSYWMSAFGTGTVLGMEYFPSFSAMLTNTYIGGYIDQQVTIEKIAGPGLVTFVRAILQIGASVS